MKTALVTGVSGGIGLAVARQLLKEGWTVYGMSRRQAPIDHPAFTHIPGDISVTEDRERFASAAQTVDALVNVAGVAPKVRSDLLDMTEESYDYVMDINTRGTFFLTQAVAKKMAVQKSGAIVNISSLSAYTSSVNRGQYCISKAGVSMITQLFADRLAEYGIPVNEIRPGIIATDMTAGVQEKYDSLIGHGLLPMARWGQPEDIAQAVYTLLSGGLPYMTGQAINIDGGFHIRRL